MFIFKSIISFLKDKSYRNLLFTTNFFIALGTVVYHYIEGWSWLGSLYFSVITLTTIGYGDFSPQTDLGKIFEEDDSQLVNQAIRQCILLLLQLRYMHVAHLYLMRKAEQAFRLYRFAHLLFVLSAPQNSDGISPKYHRSLQEIRN